MTNGCAGLVGKILGHKFEPRYSTSKKTVADMTAEQLRIIIPDEVRWAWIETIRKSNPFKYNTSIIDFLPNEILDGSRIYEGDICTRCGDMILTPDTAAKAGLDKEHVLAEMRRRN